jgi:hypothetical protein
LTPSTPKKKPLIGEQGDPPWAFFGTPSREAARPRATGSSQQVGHRDSHARPWHADAKAKGVKFGRKPKLTPHKQGEARKRIAADEPLSVSSATRRLLGRSWIALVKGTIWLARWLWSL